MLIQPLRYIGMRSSSLLPCVRINLSSFFIRFADDLEAACVETVENGQMTKDLAITIYGMANVKESQYLNTEDYLQAIADKLKAKMN